MGAVVLKIIDVIKNMLHLRKKDMKQYFKYNMPLLMLTFVNLIVLMNACFFTQTFNDARCFAWVGLLTCLVSTLICFVYSRKANSSEEFLSFLNNIYIHSLYFIDAWYVLILISVYLKWGDFYTASVLLLLIGFMALAFFCAIPTCLFKDYFVLIAIFLIALASIMNKIPRITVALTYTGIILPIVLIYSDKSNWKLMGVCSNYIHLSRTPKQTCIAFLLNIGSVALSIVLFEISKIETPLSLKEAIGTISSVKDPITCRTLNITQGIIYLFALIGHFMITFSLLLLLGYIVGGVINFVNSIKDN